MKRANRAQNDFLSSFLTVTAVGIFGYAVAKILADDTQTTHTINELYKNEGGNPNASNLLGSGQFNFKRFLQLKVDKIKDLKRVINNSLVGLECKMATAVFFFKSLGLIPPAMSRFEFEDEFTHILDKTQRVPTRKQNPMYTIPKKYNAAMRGFSNLEIEAANGSIAGEIEQKSFSDNTIIEIANNLRKTSYAKERKMDVEKLVRLNFSTRKELVTGFKNGLVSLVSLHNKNFESMHYALAVMGTFTQQNYKITLLDDSYQSIRWVDETEMVTFYYDGLKTTGIKNCWTLVPEGKLNYYQSLLKK